ncbi:MAG TPA: hypothetical protein VFB34_00535 [Chloroflexota bacterium]|nr:hypothetical protein [Chloroflexota bacterium]
MFARIARFQIKRARLDAAVAGLLNQGAASFGVLDGFRSAEVYVDREASRALYISLWDTRQQANALSHSHERQALADRLQADLEAPIEIEVYESVG